MNSIPSHKTNRSERICPVCKGIETVHKWNAEDLNWHTIGSFPYFQCKACGSLFIPAGLPLPSGAYPKGYGTYVDLGSTLIHSRIDSMANRTRASFLECRQKPGTILDVGCGSGFFLAHLQARGWQAHGLEPADEHITFAQIGLGLTDIIKDTWPPAKRLTSRFDAISMIHLLEHLEDPVNALKATYDCLREDGTVLLETPNILSWPARIFGDRWVTLDAPRHRVLFSLISLKHCLALSGFGEIRICTYSPSTMEWPESLRRKLAHTRHEGLNGTTSNVPIFSSKKARLTQRRQQLLAPLHATERLLYRWLNKVSDMMGQGCNLLATASRLSKCQ